MRRAFSLWNGFAPWLTGIVLLTFLVYSAAIGNAFVQFDDTMLIYNNPFVAHLSFGSLFHVFTSYDPELYIPLTFVVYQMIHVVAGFNPGAYHAASLFFHLLNTVLVAWIAFQLSKKRAVAIIVAALFALHPLQSEAVLWAAAMKDVLSATLGLLSLGFYLRYRSSAQKMDNVLCILFFFLGLLAKVSIAPLPVIFLLVDWLQKRPFTKNTIIEKWPYIGLSVIFIGIALAGKTAVIHSTSVGTTILLSFKATAFYLWTVIAPIHLSVLYPQIVLPSLTQPLIILSILVVGALLVIASLVRHSHRIVTFGIAWYLLFLLPTFTNFYKNEYLYFASDRYAYIPLFGIFFIVATGAASLWERSPRMRIPLGVLAGIIAVIALPLVHQQVLVWKDTQSLFTNVVQQQPESVLGYNNLGITMTDSPQSLVYFEKAIALDPKYILAYKNIASYYFKKGESDLMKQSYARGIAALDRKEHPSHDDLIVLFEYAEYLDGQGDREQTLNLLKKAITIDPLYSESHYNLGIKYEKYGNMKDAETELQQAVNLDGDNPDFLYHLAAVKAATGQLQDAAFLLEHLLSINPDYAKAQSHLDDIKRMLGE